MKMENKNLISEYKREEVEEILENKLEMSKEKQKMNMLKIK